jgi:hypothetical protein
MEITATLLQIVGLVAVIGAATVEFGATGGVAAAGIGSVYVGLAMDR